MKLKYYIISKLNTVLLLCFICIQTNVVQAQEQGYRWGKWIAGQTSSGTLSDEIVDSYIDSLGNTYILGAFGTDARLGEDGPKICPMDDGVPGYGISSSPGVFLAKIDKTGEVIWCKYAKGGNYSNTNALNMVVKNNLITIGVGISFTRNPREWYYLFDTMILEPGGTQAETIFKLFFVSFDGNGEIVVRHNIQLFAYWTPTSSRLNAQFFAMGYGSKFCIDPNNNIHLFAEGMACYDNSLHGAYYMLDDDTSRRYPMHVNTINGDPFTLTRYLKIDSSWHLVTNKDMIDSIAGWEPNNHLANLRPKKVICDGDNIFVNCCYVCNNYDSLPDAFPVKIFLDSVHFLKLENEPDFGLMPCLIKMNTNGDIEWSQQIYTETDEWWNYNEYGGLAVDEENVYSITNLSEVNHSHRHFLDNAHTELITGLLINSTLIVSYNKNTGTPVDYYLVDTVNWNNASGSSAVLGDYLILGVSYGVQFKTGLCKINKYTKEVFRSDHIDYSRIAKCKDMSINNNGWVFRAEEGEGARVEDSLFVSTQSKACVITFYYDSALDIHRPQPCPGVDSLWSMGVTGNVVSIFWQSQSDHVGYELAYIPEGGNWDDAIILNCTGTSADVSLPDNGCYQFRIRGLCDGNRIATSPWSLPITICSQMSIEEIEEIGDVEVYPNPASSCLTIEGTESIQHIEFFNAAGQKVLSQTANGSTISIDVSQVKRGAYVLRIKTLCGVVIKKLLLI